LWWIALVVAGGASLAFLVMLVATHRLPARNEAYIWPATTFPLLAVAQWRLRKCYAEGPIEGKGKWQLSLNDFLAVVFMSGVLLSFFKLVLAEHFNPVGLPFGLACGLTLPVGMLFGTRKGIQQSWCRCLFALGFSSLLIGGLVIGALSVLLTIEVIFIGESILKALSEIFITSTDSPSVFCRVGLCLLIAGAFLTSVFQRTSNRRHDAT
jgi:hypothetical protein